MTNLFQLANLHADPPLTPEQWATLEEEYRRAHRRSGGVRTVELVKARAPVLAVSTLALMRARKAGFMVN